jgi:rod shape-determining protein MreC
LLRLAVPLKVLVQRFAFMLLVLSAFALMLLSKAETALVERISIAVVDVMAPIMDVLSRPVATINETVESVRNLVALHDDNERLRRENTRLLAWQEAARRLARQNSVLQELLDFVPDPRAGFITARVISDAGGAFVRSMLVNAGTRNGVAKGQAAVAGDGLVGRVSAAGSRSARILLITDINSRVPVLVEASNNRAILAGDNSELPRLIFLAANAAIKPGDRIITSGHGGMFPPGLPAGEVVSIGEGGIRIRPFVGLGRLEFVRVVDYAGIPTDIPDNAGREKEPVE